MNSNQNEVISHPKNNDTFHISNLKDVALNTIEIEKLYYIKNKFNVYSPINEIIRSNHPKNEYEKHIDLFSSKVLQYLKFQGLIRDI